LPNDRSFFLLAKILAVNHPGKLVTKAALRYFSLRYRHKGVQLKNLARGGWHRLIKASCLRPFARDKRDSRSSIGDGIS